MKTYHRHLIYLFLAGLLVFTLVSACNRAVDRNVIGSQELVKDCRIVQHVMGESCIPRDPQRIIVLGSYDVLGNLLAIGLKPVASSSGWDTIEPFPKHLQARLKEVEYTGSTTQPSLEKVLLLKPDLILTNDHLEAFYSQLDQIAPTVVMQNEKLWKQKLTDLGLILGKEDIANQLMDDYQQRIDELKQGLGNKRADLIVSIATMTADFGVWAYGSRFATSIVLNDIGVRRPPSQIGDFNYTEKISVEKLDAIDGDILFFVTRRNEEDNKAITRLRQNPLWEKLKVVQNEQVYSVALDYWYLDNSILGINAVLDDLFKYFLALP